MLSYIVLTGSNRLFLNLLHSQCLYSPCLGFTCSNQIIWLVYSTVITWSWNDRNIYLSFRHFTHTHTVGSSLGSKTWRASSSLPCVSSRLLPRLYGRRPGVKGHLGWVAFLPYSCLCAHFALSPLWVAAAALCCHFKVRVQSLRVEGGGGCKSELMSCHTALKKKVTVVQESEDLTGTQYLLIHEKM